MTTLWPHQQAAVDKLLPLGKGLLAMDVGTGKSLTALELIRRWDCRCVLIACPLSMVNVWPKEFIKHGFDNWSVLPLSTGSTKQRADSLLTQATCAEVDGKPFAAILNYDAMISDAMKTALGKLSFDCLLLDESQKIKSDTAKISLYTAKLARQIPHVIGATGTPLHDTPLDVFGQFRTINPDVFGTNYYRFQETFAITEEQDLREKLPGMIQLFLKDISSLQPGLSAAKKKDLSERYGKKIADRIDTGNWPPQAGADRKAVVIEMQERYLAWRLHKAPYMRTKVKEYRNQDLLKDRMAPYTHFCSKRDVLDLPPTLHEERYCMLTPKSRSAYEAMRDELRAELETGELTAANAASKSVRLRQITNGFGKDSEGNLFELGGEKQALLTELLEDLPTSEQVVVIGGFHHDLDAIHAAAKACDRTSSELSGRKKELEDWQAGKTNILAVQYDAGGAGVSFVNACYQIYFSHPYSLGQYEQTLGRIDRPGQTRPVTYIHLVALNTIDEQVSAILQAKGDLNSAIIAELKRGGKRGNTKNNP